MRAEIAGLFERTEQRTWRRVAVLSIGPLTMLAGLVWAVAQPYRLTLLDAAPNGIWDQIARPRVLVASIGLLFHFAVERPLVQELDRT